MSHTVRVDTYKTHTSGTLDGYKTYHIYAVLNSETDVVNAIVDKIDTAQHNWQTIINATHSLYKHAYGNVISKSIQSNIFPMFNELEYTTTFGTDVLIFNQSTDQTEGINPLTDNETSYRLTVNGATYSAIYNEAPTSVGETKEVVVAQITTEGTINGNITLDINNQRYNFAFDSTDPNVSSVHTIPTNTETTPDATPQEIVSANVSQVDFTLPQGTKSLPGLLIGPASEPDIYTGTYHGEIEILDGRSQEARDLTYTYNSGGGQFTVREMPTVTDATTKSTTIYFPYTDSTDNTELNNSNFYKSSSSTSQRVFFYNTGKTYKHNSTNDEYYLYFMVTIGVMTNNSSTIIRDIASKFLRKDDNYEFHPTSYFDTVNNVENSSQTNFTALNKQLYNISSITDQEYVDTLAQLETTYGIRVENVYNHTVTDLQYGAQRIKSLPYEVVWAVNPDTERFPDFPSVENVKIFDQVAPEKDPQTEANKIPLAQAQLFMNGAKIYTEIDVFLSTIITTINTELYSIGSEAVVSYGTAPDEYAYKVKVLVTERKNLPTARAKTMLEPYITVEGYDNTTSPGTTTPMFEWYFLRKELYYYDETTTTYQGPLLMEDHAMVLSTAEVTSLPAYYSYTYNEVEENDAETDDILYPRGFRYEFPIFKEESVTANQEAQPYVFPISLIRVNNTYESAYNAPLYRNIIQITTDEEDASTELKKERYEDSLTMEHLGYLTRHNILGSLSNNYPDHNKEFENTYVIAQFNHDAIVQTIASYHQGKNTRIILDQMNDLIQTAGIYYPTKLDSSHIKPFYFSTLSTQETQIIEWDEQDGNSGYHYRSLEQQDHNTGIKLRYTSDDIKRVAFENITFIESMHTVTYSVSDLDTIRIDYIPKYAKNDDINYHRTKSSAIINSQSSSLINILQGATDVTDDPRFTILNPERNTIDYNVSQPYYQESEKPNYIHSNIIKMLFQPVFYMNGITQLGSPATLLVWDEIRKSEETPFAFIFNFDEDSDATKKVKQVYTSLTSREDGKFVVTISLSTAGYSDYSEDGYTDNRTPYEKKYGFKLTTRTPLFKIVMDSLTSEIGVFNTEEHVDPVFYRGTIPSTIIDLATNEEFTCELPIDKTHICHSLFTATSPATAFHIKGVRLNTNTIEIYSPVYTQPTTDGKQLEEILFLDGETGDVLTLYCDPATLETHEDSKSLSTVHLQSFFDDNTESKYIGKLVFGKPSDKNTRRYNSEFFTPAFEKITDTTTQIVPNVFENIPYYYFEQETPVREISLTHYDGSVKTYAIVDIPEAQVIYRRTDIVPQNLKDYHITNQNTLHIISDYSTKEDADTPFGEIKPKFGLIEIDENTTTSSSQGETMSIYSNITQDAVNYFKIDTEPISNITNGDILTSLYTHPSSYDTDANAETNYIKMKLDNFTLHENIVNGNADYQLQVTYGSLVYVNNNDTPADLITLEEAIHGYLSEHALIGSDPPSIDLNDNHFNTEWNFANAAYDKYWKYNEQLVGFSQDRTYRYVFEIDLDTSDHPTHIYQWKLMRRASTNSGSLTDKHILTIKVPVEAVTINRSYQLEQYDVETTNAETGNGYLSYILFPTQKYLLDKGIYKTYALYGTELNSGNLGDYIELQYTPYRAYVLDATNITELTENIATPIYKLQFVSTGLSVRTFYSHRQDFEETEDTTSSDIIRIVHEDGTVNVEESTEYTALFDEYSESGELQIVLKRQLYKERDVNYEYEEIVLLTSDEVEETYYKVIDGPDVLSTQKPTFVNTSIGVPFDYQEKHIIYGKPQTIDGDATTTPLGYYYPAYRELDPQTNAITPVTVEFLVDGSAQTFYIDVTNSRYVGNDTFLPVADETIEEYTLINVIQFEENGFMVYGSLCIIDEDTEERHFLGTENIYPLYTVNPEETSETDTPDVYIPVEFCEIKDDKSHIFSSRYYYKTAGTSAIAQLYTTLNAHVANNEINSHQYRQCLTSLFNELSQIEKSDREDDITYYKDTINQFIEYPTTLCALYGVSEYGNKSGWIYPAIMRSESEYLLDKNEREQKQTLQKVFRTIAPELHDPNITEKAVPQLLYYSVLSIHGNTAEQTTSSIAITNTITRSITNQTNTNDYIHEAAHIIDETMNGDKPIKSSAITMLENLSIQLPEDVTATEIAETNEFIIDVNDIVKDQRIVVTYKDSAQDKHYLSENANDNGRRYYYNGIYEEGRYIVKISYDVSESEAISTHCLLYVSEYNTANQFTGQAVEGTNKLSMNVNIINKDNATGKDITMQTRANSEYHMSYIPYTSQLSYIVPTSKGYYGPLFATNERERDLSIVTASLTFTEDDKQFSKRIGADEETQLYRPEMVPAKFSYTIPVNSVLHPNSNTYMKLSIDSKTISTSKYTVTLDLPETTLSWSTLVEEVKTLSSVPCSVNIAGDETTYSEVHIDTYHNQNIDYGIDIYITTNTETLLLKGVIQHSDPEKGYTNQDDVTKTTHVMNVTLDSEETTIECVRGASYLIANTSIVFGGKYIFGQPIRAKEIGQASFADIPSSSTTYKYGFYYPVFSSPLNDYQTNEIVFKDSDDNEHTVYIIENDDSYNVSYGNVQNAKLFNIDNMRHHDNFPPYNQQQAYAIYGMDIYDPERPGQYASKGYYYPVYRYNEGFSKTLHVANLDGDLREDVLYLPSEVKTINTYNGVSTIDNKKEGTIEFSNNEADKNRFNLAYDPYTVGVFDKPGDVYDAIDSMVQSMSTEENETPLDLQDILASNNLEKLISIEVRQTVAFAVQVKIMSLIKTLMVKYGKSTNRTLRITSGSLHFNDTLYIMNKKINDKQNEMDLQSANGIIPHTNSETTINLNEIIGRKEKNTFVFLSDLDSEPSLISLDETTTLTMKIDIETKSLNTKAIVVTTPLVHSINCKVRTLELNNEVET